MKEETNKWWQSALLDIDSAKKNLKIQIYHVSTFLSQQAVEKGLKALLIERTNEFPKTHDLPKLSTMLDAPDRITKLCETITPMYTATRYPDVGMQFNKNEVKEIIKHVEEVLKWIKKQLES